MDGEKLKLSEKNVLTIFRESLDSSKSYIYGVDLFLPGARQKPAIMYIDRKKLLPHLDEVHYMVGQLLEVHEKDILIFGKGSVDYNHNKWTDNTSSLYALYYLGMCCRCFTAFTVRNGKMAAELLPRMEPTFYPPK
ncbi:MAG: hypothetical protein K2P37_03445 [Oscillospiraceae bacterium]|nr:hypothetical protein [Oscillospiraceae bacterium]